MKMLGRHYGNRGDPARGMDPRYRTPETQRILDCLVYLPCVLHPLVLIIMNADYRQGLRNAWKTLPCNSSNGRSPSSNAAARGNERQVRYPPAAAKPIIKTGNKIYGTRKNDKIMAGENQPFIVPVQNGPSAGFYATQPTTPFIPMEPLNGTNQLVMNNSYETENSPQAGNLPAKFEYGRFQYVDTARVEPQIAYTPTNTPPKTPQVPHFDRTPFKQPNYVDGNWILPEDQEAYRGKECLLTAYRKLIC